VWSWVTELLLFGVVPSVMLLLNVFVVCETRRLSAEEKKLCSSVRLVHHVNDRQVAALMFYSEVNDCANTTFADNRLGPDDQFNIW
jgi:hypothetical protein